MRCETPRRISIDHGTAVVNVSWAATSRAPNHENPLYWISTSPFAVTVTWGRLPSKLAR